MKIFLTLLSLFVGLIPGPGPVKTPGAAQVLSIVATNSFSGSSTDQAFGHKALLTMWPGDGVYFNVNGVIAPSTPQWTITDNSGNEFRVVIKDLVGTPWSLYNKISLAADSQINIIYEASDSATDPPSTSYTPVGGSGTEDWYFDLEQKISGVWTVVRRSQMVEPAVVAPNAHPVQDVYAYNGSQYVFYKKTNAVPPSCPTCPVANPKSFNGQAIILATYITGAARALGPSNQQACNRGMMYYPFQGQPGNGLDARHLISDGIVSSGYPNVEQLNFAVNTWVEDYTLFQIGGAYYEPTLFCRGETGPPSGDWYITWGPKFSIDWI